MVRWSYIKKKFCMQHSGTWTLSSVYCRPLKLFDQKKNNKYVLPCWLSSKEFICNAGDMGSIPGLGRYLGEGNDNLLQYSCLENPMDRGAWWVTVHGVTKSRTQLKQLSMHAYNTK